MKRNFIILIFLLPILTVFTGKVHAQQEEKSFDVVGEIAYGEECLKTWQIEAEASGRVGNWRSGLGLAYPHFHEDVSVSVPFV